MPLEFKNWNKGDALTAEAINKIQDELRRIGSIRGSGNCSVNRDSTGITIRGLDPEPTKWVAVATIDPESGFSYPTFYDYSDQTQLTTIYPFRLYTASFEEDSWTPTLDGSPRSIYVYAFTLSGHYIPQNTTTVIDKIGPNWFSTYTLPATMHLTLTEDLDFESSAEATFLPLQYYHGAQLTGTIVVWDGYLKDGKKLASGSHVAVSMWGFYPTVIASNNCATAVT